MQPDFASDFFNNAAAVAMILVFTKIVTHRVRAQPRKEPSKLLHIVAVMAALLALTVSLLATELRSPNLVFHLLTWAGLLAAGGILLSDTIEQDLRS